MRWRAVAIRAFCCVLMAGLGRSVARAADASFAGTYKAEKLTLVLVADGAQAGHYTGTLKFGASTFTATCQTSDAGLAGTFDNKGNTYPFTATVDGETMMFRTASALYELKREPPNPLDVPPAPAPVSKPKTEPAAVAPASPTSPAAPDPRGVPHTPAHTTATRAEVVQKAIEKAKAYLYARQKDGNWEEAPARREADDLYAPTGGQWGGYTALATYALLAARENPQDPRIIKAVDFLKHANLVGTYAIGMRAQVWNLLPPPVSKEIRDAAARDAVLLMKAARTKGPEKAFFHYTENDEGYDHSASQYGVLGLWACAQAGIDVPAHFWSEVEQAWQRDESREGAWSYVGPCEDNGTPAMTAAGVATLFITQDYVHAAEGLEGHGNIVNPAIELGLKWISDHYGQIVPGAEHFYYTLYGVERIGVASGHKYFGQTDWYATGADQLTQTQREDGSFGDGIPDTCFAILFLVRGSAPVALNKLEYNTAQRGGKSIVGNWNERPRDAANVSRWLGRQTERDLNWQIVNLGVSVDDLHDSPILYIAGNLGLSFTPEEEAKLKQFVEEGGMILGNSDGNSIAFAQTFKKLGQKLFPAYEFRDLPAQHIIYNNEFNRSKWKTPPVVQGMSNGCRELMLLFPVQDPARMWQMKLIPGKEDAHQLFANIFLYAVDKKDLRSKGETYIVRPDPAVTPARSVKLARVQYPGNWDPEPGGWRRLAAVLHNQYGTELSIDAVKLGEGKLAGYKVAHLTGTSTYHFPEPQRAELKSFLEGGGTLIIDAAGGSTEFATSVESDLTLMFGKEADSLHLPLDIRNPVFAAVDPKIDSVNYRPHALRLVGRLKGPRIKAIDVKGRPAVLFSAEDLSAGLVGQAVDGIAGYDPASATALMADMVLYATQK